MTDTKPLPTGQPTEFKVAKCELKKELPARDGKPPAVVLKLGLVGPNGEKGWAEHFAPTTDPAKWPGEGRKETFIVEPPKQEGWLPSAKRPRQGGKGGPRGQTHPEDARRMGRSHSQEMALRLLAIIAQYDVAAGRDASGKELHEGLKELTDWFERDIAGGKS